MKSLITAMVMRLRSLLREMLEFGLVGAVGMVVDLGGYNLLTYDTGGGGMLHDRPLIARTLSIIAATIVTYIGNRIWTWRDRQRRGVHREYALFFALNIVGWLLNIGVLSFAIYVLRLDGLLWENLASLVGIGLGTLFRFWSYRNWVFRETASEQSQDQRELSHI